MAVLCEGISVIVRRDSIDERFTGGWAAFEELVPNATLCSDGELARVGFMNPDSVEDFVSELEVRGLTFDADEFRDAAEAFGVPENELADELNREDIAVVDQVRGPTRPCAWLEFGRFPMGQSPVDKVSMCWLFEGERILGEAHYFKEKSMQLHAPTGWRYEGSLSQKFGFVPTEDFDDRLTYLRSEAGLDVYLDRATGKEVFVGRPKI